MLPNTIPSQVLNELDSLLSAKHALNLGGGEANIPGGGSIFILLLITTA